MTEGEVRKVDKVAGTVTIKHGRIENLGMPGMTMTFKAADPRLLDNLNPGDKVKFHAEQPDGMLTVTAVEPASVIAGVSTAAADARRQAEVSQRGADVMPFSLKATTHVFSKTADGGVQRVIAKDGANVEQVKLIRLHLHDIQAQFLKGDFSGPTHIHGQEMPGLAGLKAAKPGQIAIGYRDVDGGAELTYRTADASLVTALHNWFDAQLSDHGSDAMAGHDHMHGTQQDH